MMFFTVCVAYGAKVYSSPFAKPCNKGVKKYKQRHEEASAEYTNYRFHGLMEYLVLWIPVLGLNVVNSHVYLNISSL